MPIRHKSTFRNDQETPIEVARAYELLIATDEADLHTYLNLVVLYFVCNDFGYASAYHLSSEFMGRSWDRAMQLLDIAEQRFGTCSEIDFWRLYLPFIHLGEPFFDEECRKLARAGDSLIPYFYLFAFAHGEEEFLGQAEQLMRIVSSRSTAKERYIYSVLEAAFADLARNRG